MKYSAVLFFCLACLSAFSQELKNQDVLLDVNFGAFKTSYHKNTIEIEKEDFKSILFTNKEAKSEYRKGKTYTTFGMIIGIPSAFLLFTQLKDMQRNPPILGVFIGSVIGTAGGYLLNYVGEGKITKSVILYNKQNVETSINIKPNSLGLAINF